MLCDHTLSLTAVLRPSVRVLHLWSGGVVSCCTPFVLLCGVTKVDVLYGCFVLHWSAFCGSAHGIMPLKPHTALRALPMRDSRLSRESFGDEPGTLLFGPPPLTQETCRHGLAHFADPELIFEPLSSKCDRRDAEKVSPASSGPSLPPLPPQPFVISIGGWGGSPFGCILFPHPPTAVCRSLTSWSPPPSPVFCLVCCPPSPVCSHPFPL